MFIKDHFLIAPPSIHTVITPPQCGGLDGCEHPKGGQCLKVVKMYHGHLFHHQPAHHCLSYHTAPVALCRAVSSLIPLLSTTAKLFRLDQEEFIKN